MAVYPISFNWSDNYYLSSANNTNNPILCKHGKADTVPVVLEGDTVVRLRDISDELPSRSTDTKGPVAVRNVGWKTIFITRKIHFNASQCRDVK